MGPWPLFYHHTSFSSETKSGISFMAVGSQTFKLSKQYVKSRNNGMTEGHGKSNKAPLFQSAAIIEKKEHRSLCHFHFVVKADMKMIREI